MKVAYVGHFNYAKSNAAGLRVKGVAHALAIAGNEILIGCDDPASEEPPCWPGASRVAVRGLAHEVSAAAPGHERLWRQLTRGNVTARWLAQLRPPPEVIIVYGTHFGYLARIIPIARKIGVPIVVDVTEWYGLRDIPSGRMGPLIACGYELSMRFLVPRANGVLVISRFLEDYYGSLGCRVLRLPPLIEERDERPSQYRESDSRLHLCYAGTPGTKDELPSILEALDIAAKERLEIVLHLVGFSKNELLEYQNRHKLRLGLEFGSVSFVCHGWLDNSAAREIVASSDFTVLLRRPTRRTQAGFSSKIAESLSLGTPVISNLTSDLRFVLNDRNSIAAKDYDKAAFLEAVRRAASLSEVTLQQMKLSTFKEAHIEFSPSHNSSVVHGYLASLVDPMVSGIAR